ncbi:MAG: YceI family protein [Lewinellaceae bacterium]|nr:YceI family protein [Lewinellaceae bacterium]
MKNVKFYLAFVAGILVYAMVLHTSSCTREDAPIGTIEPPDYQYGTETVKNSEGWNFDKTHSSALWETNYLGVSALLTGRFNTFSAKAEFDEDNPENSSLSGFVVLSTVNTGEPGRDAGCLLGTFGVTTISDTARLTSKKFELDGKGGYIVTAELDFHGVKKDVTMQLNYTPMTHFDVDSGISGAPYAVAGLTGQFEFNAKSDFLIVSPNIADRVVIKLNAQFKKPG